MDGAGGRRSVVNCGALFKVEESVHTMVHVSMVGREQYLYAYLYYGISTILR